MSLWTKSRSWIHVHLNKNRKMFRYFQIKLLNKYLIIVEKRKTRILFEEGRFQTAKLINCIYDPNFYIFCNYRLNFNWWDATIEAHLPWSSGQANSSFQEFTHRVEGHLQYEFFEGVLKLQCVRNAFNFLKKLTEHFDAAILWHYWHKSRLNITCCRCSLSLFLVR